MPLSTEAQALFDHARNALPRWLHAGRASVLEWLYGFTAVFDAARLLAEEYYEGIFLDSATGRWLDQHARDRDTTRRVDESDSTLRERIRQVEDSITDPALQDGINAILGAFIDIGSPETITIGDDYNTITRTIQIPIGTYTAAEFIDLVRDQLLPGWTFTLINARYRWNMRNPETGDNELFDVTYGSVEIGEYLGFDVTGSVANWDVTTDGYYESDSTISRACAIINLRRDRGHFHITGESTTFMNRGYRMAGSGRLGYVVLLPFGTSEAEAEAVREYLRQYGAGGFEAIVEVKA